MKKVYEMYKPEIEDNTSFLSEMLYLDEGNGKNHNGQSLKSRAWRKYQKLLNNRKNTETGPEQDEDNIKQENSELVINKEETPKEIEAKKIENGEEPTEETKKEEQQAADTKFSDIFKNTLARQNGIKHEGDNDDDEIINSPEETIRKPDSLVTKMKNGWNTVMSDTLARQNGIEHEGDTIGDDELSDANTTKGVSYNATNLDLQNNVYKYRVKLDKIKANGSNSKEAYRQFYMDGLKLLGRVK